jgi:hypothetical protein
MENSLHCTFPEYRRASSHAEQIHRFRNKHELSSLDRYGATFFTCHHFLKRNTSLDRHSEAINGLSFLTNGADADRGNGEKMSISRLTRSGAFHAGSHSRAFPSSPEITARGQCAGGLQSGSTWETAGKRRASARPKPSTIADPRAERFDGELHGGHRARLHNSEFHENRGRIDRYDQSGQENAS